jgi:uncharacterized protein YjbJ (UPF0337 family)
VQSGTSGISEIVSHSELPKAKREVSMNWDQIEGKWKQFAGKAKEKWGKLTDDDLDVIRGKRDQLIGKIQERYGIAKQEAEHQVDEFTRSFRTDAASREAGETEREDSASASRREKAHGAGKS